MCTLSWWSGPKGYEIFFNRDERRTRRPAIPPAIHHAADGTRYLAPEDGNAGGTWLLVNEHGLTLAILNFYEREPSGGEETRDFRSRGLLMSDFAASRTLEEVEKGLREVDLTQYKAFSMMAFAQADSFRAWLWQFDGQTLNGPDRNPPLPVCSSSFQSEEVVARRRQIFRKLFEGRDLTPEGLAEYHHWDGGRPDAFTVKMNRPDAQTWSISRVRVGRDAITFQYEELGSGQEAPGETFSIELGRAS